MITEADIKRIAQEIKACTSQGKWIRGLRTASQYAKINRQRLEKLLRAGEIRGYIDTETGKPTWILDRESIDAYHNKRIDGDQAEIDKKVVAFLKGSRTK